MSTTRLPIISVTEKDLEFQYFRGSGAGGQHRNKASTACRCIHKASGAVGTAQDERSQAQNKKLAFRRMAESKKFQVWIKTQAAVILQGYKDLEAKVDEMMRPENIKEEYYDPTK